MPARTTSIIETLPINLQKIFDQAQDSVANHQKNRVSLHKLHTEAAGHVRTLQDGKDTKLVGERAFEDLFIGMVNHVLHLKKGILVADRVAKFVGGYVRFVSEKAAEEARSGEEEEDTTASRFVTCLLRHLLKGFLAKDRYVRYRVVQLVAEMISHLGEIDDDVYTLLRSSLLERTQDKEPFVRIQAVIALSKLSGTEDPEDLGEDEPDVIDVLIDVLQFDPAVEVRRATLLHTPVIQRTLPAILSRTRDADDVIRKMVYSHVLERLHHPKQLTITQRELIVRNGLGDRQASVRAAAGKLIGTWVDVVGGLLDFLQTFDLLGSEIAEDALRSVFVIRPDILDKSEFDENFWNILTPEKAFLVRVFVEYCINTKDEGRLESSLPVVTSLAFKIQAAYNDLIEVVQAEDEGNFPEGLDEDTQDKREEERADREFVINEMLKLAVNLDYSDEIGRRKMFGLVRDMISQESLPEGLVSKCLDVLRVLSPNERDLIRVVVEVVHELRDPSEPDKEDLITHDGTTQASDTPRTNKIASTPVPRTEKDGAREALIDVRCLNLCIGMLERVNGTFEDNSTLEGILGELILPSVRAKEMALRERGLVSLGLCCLIARRMALNSFQLFVNQVQTAPEVLKIRVLKIVFDILMVHENEFLGRPGDTGERIVDFLLHVLENEESEEAQAVVCVGISKLMLSGMISEERVLKSLVLAYVSPYTKNNQELRQCLSYFFPVYCYSSSANQRKMQKIALSAYETLSKTYLDLDEDLETIPLSQVALLLADWTDPRNAIDMDGKVTDEDIHLDFAIDVLKILLKSGLDKNDKKILSQILGKLYIPDNVDDDKIRTMKLLINNLQNRRPLKEAIAKNALARFDKSLLKRFATQLESFDEKEFRKLENLKELFEFLDEIDSDDDDGKDLTPPPKRRVAKSKSVANISDDEDFELSTPAPKSKGKSRSTAKIAGDSESPLTTRSLPRRAAKSKLSTIVKSYESDSTSSESGYDSATTPPAKRKARTSDKHKIAKRAKEMGEGKTNNLSDSQDDVSEPTVDSEDEEEEVDSLLLSDEE